MPASTAQLIRSSITDTWLAYITWSLITGLPHELHQHSGSSLYAPLQSPDIPRFLPPIGLLVALVLLCSVCLQRPMRSHPSAFYAVSILAFASSRVLPLEYLSDRLGLIDTDCLCHLLVVASAAVNIAAFHAALGHASKTAQAASHVTHLLGLLLLLIVRFRFHSLNPFWMRLPESQSPWFLRALALSLLACGEQLVRYQSWRAESSPPNEATGAQQPRSSAALPSAPRSSSERVGAKTDLLSVVSGLCFSAGYGSLLYLTTELFAEAGIVYRWASDSPDYIIAAKLTVLGCTFVAGLLGTLFYFRNAVSTVASLLALLVIAFTLSSSPAFVFLSGLALGTVLVFFWPFSLAQFSEHKRTFPLEATAFAVFLLLSHSNGRNLALMDHLELKHAPVLIAATLLRFLDLLAPSENKFEWKRFRAAGFLGLALVAVLVVPPTALESANTSARLGLAHSAAERVVPSHSTLNEPFFTVAVWNAQLGVDNDGRTNFEGIGRVLNDTRAEVIGLFNATTSYSLYGGNDLVLWLSEYLGMHSAHCLRCGVALLSKFPIVDATCSCADNAWTIDKEAVLSASVNVSRRGVARFIVANARLDKAPLSRPEQEAKLAPLLSALDSFPQNASGVALLSLFVKSDSPLLYHILEKGHCSDIDDSDTNRFENYILSRMMYPLSFARISGGGQSSSDIQLGTYRFAVSEYDSLAYRDFVNMNEIHKMDVYIRGDVRSSTPSAFGPFSSVRYTGKEHRYHMGTPKYFYCPACFDTDD